MIRESERLSREIGSAFLVGWYKHHHGGPRPIGKAAITKIEQAGWDAYEDRATRTALEALREYMA